MKKNNASLYDWLHALLHYFVIYFLFMPYYHYSYKVKINGRSKVPKNRPILIVSNHYSYNDPPLISYVTGRPTAWIAKEELFQGKPSFARIITALGAVPIDREKPKPSTIKQFREAVSAKWSVGIFIEGTRNLSRTHMTSLNQGPAVLARLGGGLDVLPVGIVGGESKGDSLTVNVGDIIPFDKNKSPDEMTVIYGEAIASLAELELNIDNA